ncbi:sigma-70 family RNA polymerase sigma factor [Kribbella sandramycini]|uniref:RNA polymerase sigma factor (Sigma-70 family) n=1 Tax=Kribbella sandramycini TaxID=60450 RepID=A0A7Y4L3Q3_9ACTN|nr:sigma-70 family RNA polymerase sigma factor [Kribbella sandramycini]MBB6570602.1 RNA polymerase sigma factor (sigma-70 family) [Kribbella sandramycini]NOL43747.1 sigma-70 family RNA polymerase sigma factor [Kribbella sandramycini]
MPTSGISDDHLLEDLLRELTPQVLGVVVRRTGDFAAAEDAVQEALLAAATTWPRDGRPDNPKAWLIQTALRRFIDEVRQEQARRRREEKAALRDIPPEEVEEQDDTLRLLFLCCHPSLTPASAIALTLRAVGGLTTAEIATAYLVPEATMAQRISRAKGRLKGATFELATDADDRLRNVLHVLYLMFNEGYASSSGPELHRSDLSSEAIRLTRAVRRQLDNGQVTGLLALMLLTDARRAARTGSAGELIPLADQDRSLWNQTYITEGVELAVQAFSSPPLGEYQLQAAIAALHDEVDRAEDTDWPQILALYGLLESLSGNPMVKLNRAIAAAMVDGPDAGLKLLEPLDDELRGNHRLDATRGHLYEMRGDLATAVEHFRAAALGTTSIPERDYLTLKAAALNDIARKPR